MTIHHHPKMEVAHFRAGSIASIKRPGAHCVCFFVIYYSSRERVKLIKTARHPNERKKR